MNQTVAAALISVALHVNALSGSGLGWRRVFVMAIGNGIPVRAFFFFSSLAERAITAVPVTALPLEAIATSSAMPRFHQAESNNKRKQNNQQPSKTNNATPTRHKPKTKPLSGN